MSSIAVAARDLRASPHQLLPLVPAAFYATLVELSTQADVNHDRAHGLLNASAVAAGAKLFYLSGMRNGKYMKREVLNLARFISVTKFRPLSWRGAHPYLVADRFEVSHVCAC